MSATPTPRPPAAPVPPRARSYARWFTGTLLAALLATYLPFPWHLVVGPLAVGATILATMAFWHTAGHAGMTTLRVLLGMGALMAAFLVVLGVGLILVAPDAAELERCLNSSLTPEGDQQCRNAFEDEVLGRFGAPPP